MSDGYCKKEKYLFEFVNRIGAFIAYIFIESMRPSDDDFIARGEKRNKLGSILFTSSINTSELFTDFCSLFVESGLIRQSDNGQFFEVDNNDFEKLIEVFQRVYPKIYDGLEKYWISSRKAWLWFDKHRAKTNKCSHQWKDTYVYKFRKCYRCYKCQTISDEKISNELTRERSLR